MSDSKQSMGKVIGQLHNTVTELKGKVWTLLGNLYKCLKSNPKGDKQYKEITCKVIVSIF